MLLRLKIGMLHDYKNYCTCCESKWYSMWSTSLREKHSLGCIKCNWCCDVSSFIPYIPKTHSFTCAHKYEYILPVATDFPQNSDMYVDTVKQMHLVHSLEWHQMFKYTAVE